MSNTDEGPYEEGKLAAADGEPIRSNPYEKGSDEYDLWREGYRSNDDEEDEDEG